MKYEDIPERYRGLWHRAVHGRSRQAAIRLNCLMCCCYQIVEVQNCGITACPLWRYRMGKKPLDAPEADGSEIDAPGRPHATGTNKEGD